MAWYNVGLRSRLLKALGASAPTFSHVQSLARLQAAGFLPKTIYDIGAFHGDWSRDASAVFPHAEFILFEANHAVMPHLSRTGFWVENVALASKDEQRTLFLPKAESAFTGTSLYRETTGHFDDDKIVPTAVSARRLDRLSEERGFPPPDMMKLDVQGAELEVLSGAGTLLSSCQAIVIELALLPYNHGAPMFAELAGWLDSAGFRLVDVAEIHRQPEGQIMQADGVFVRDDLMTRLAANAGLATSLAHA